ncbi:MAG: hypothetical protein ACLUFT_12230 [Gemmiger formicilis]|uniref:hypothetical protein n=1 Tax=Gemmiger formicilis TaxID=745368 RepID=UPI0039962C02
MTATAIADIMGLSGLPAGDQIAVDTVGADGRLPAGRSRGILTSDFGAKGDGSRITAAIQAAIDRAVSTLHAGYIRRAPHHHRAAGHPDLQRCGDHHRRRQMVGGRSPALIGENPSTAIIKKTGNAAKTMPTVDS